MPHDEYKINTVIQELVRRTNDESRRLRNMEQKMDVIESKLNAIEDSNIEKMKKINSRFAELEVSIKDVNEAVIKFKSNLDKINKQMINFAMRRDLKEIERMFELLSPIRQEFITKDRLEDELREVK